GMALLTLGILSYQLGDLTAAHDYLEASAEVGRELGRGAWWVIYALLYRALAEVDHQDYTAARSVLRESLGRWQELGNRATLARLLVACAHLAAAEGRAEQALRLAGAAELLRVASRRPVST